MFYGFLSRVSKRLFQYERLFDSRTEATLPATKHRHNYQDIHNFSIILALSLWA
jgi:hypothetical protein